MRRHQLAHVGPPALAHLRSRYGVPPLFVLDLGIRKEVVALGIQVDGVTAHAVSLERGAQILPDRAMPTLVLRGLAGVDGHAERTTNHRLPPGAGSHPDTVQRLRRHLASRKHQLAREGCYTWQNQHTAPRGTGRAGAWPLSSRFSVTAATAARSPLPAVCYAPRNFPRPTFSRALAGVTRGTLTLTTKVVPGGIRGARLGGAQRVPLVGRGASPPRCCRAHRIQQGPVLPAAPHAPPLRPPRKSRSDPVSTHLRAASAQTVPDRLRGPGSGRVLPPRGAGGAHARRGGSAGRAHRRRQPGSTEGSAEERG